MAAKSKIVLYHSPFAPAKAFSVLKENKDGTIDIGTADGVVVVRGCKLTDAPEHGSATIHIGVTEAEEKELTSIETAKLLFEKKTRDELLASVVDFNATAGDKKIVIAPTVSHPELVEKLMAAKFPSKE